MTETIDLPPCQDKAGEILTRPEPSWSEETGLDKAQMVKPPRKDYLTRITPETSRAMREKWIAAKKARELSGQGLKAEPEPGRVDVEPETFEELELRLTREQIKLTREALKKERDPDAQFKLGCLLKKLWEIEQLLSSRPGPGTRKPAPVKSLSAQPGFTSDQMD